MRATECSVRLRATLNTRVFCRLRHIHTNYGIGAAGAVFFQNYGYTDLAGEVADKTILLFGKDIEENNAMHEYYDPETGRGVYNRDFLSWNMLVSNMIAWKENRQVISEI